ncbi:MAG: hypothetical protein ACYDHD_08540 [Vulcanimicrobiaceae bacterium]
MLQVRSQPPYALRPLDAGELLDRAITLYVKNWTLFVWIGFVVALLRQVFYRALTAFVVRWFPSNSGVGSSSPNHGDPALRMLDIVLGLVVGGLLLPLLYAACAQAVTLLYEGERPSVSRCFRVALQRWPRCLLPAALAMISIAVLLIGIAAAAVVIFLAIKTMGQGDIMLAVTIYAVILVALVVIAVLGALSLVASTYALIAAGLEPSAPGKAVQVGFVRVFARIERGRALVLTVGAIPALVAVGGTYAAVRSAVGNISWARAPVENVVQVLLGAVIQIIVPIIFTLYYFDVRMRWDGLDLADAFARYEA